MHDVTHSRLLTIVATIAAVAAVGAAYATQRLPPAQVTVSAAPPAALAPEPPRTFTVSGVASLQALPDAADVNATLAVEDDSPRRATDRATARQAELTKALLAAGVPQRDVALTPMRLEPILHPKTHVVLRHRAAIGVTVSTRDFGRLGSLTQVLAGAGATEIATSMRVTDLPALKHKVRRMAAAAARDKASELADAVGFTVGKVRSISELPGDSWGWNGRYFNVVVREVSADVPHGDLQNIMMTIEITYDLA